MNGPVASFEDIRFQTRPSTFGLRVVIAVVAVALRAHSPVVVQQLPISVAALLPIPIGVNVQAQRGQLEPKYPL